MLVGVFILSKGGDVTTQCIDAFIIWLKVFMVILVCQVLRTCCNIAFYFYLRDPELVSIKMDIYFGYLFFLGELTAIIYGWTLIGKYSRAECEANASWISIVTLLSIGIVQCLAYIFWIIFKILVYCTFKKWAQ